MNNQTEVLNAVRRRERLRCNSLAAENFEQLAEVLSKDLLHVHTRGNSDNYESYLQYVQSKLRLLNVARGELLLRQYGDAVVMTGTQTNTAEIREGDGTVLEIQAHVTQVWVKEADGEWRLASFQATSLGAPKTLRGPER